MINTCISRVLAFCVLKSVLKLRFRVSSTFWLFKAAFWFTCWSTFRNTAFSFCVLEQLRRWASVGLPVALPAALGQMAAGSDLSLVEDPMPLVDWI